MVKVLHTPLVERICVKDGKEYTKKANPEVIYSLLEDETGIELSFNARSQQYSLRFDYTECAGTVMEVALVETDKINDVMVYPIYHVVSRNSFLRNSASPDFRIARIVFDEECKNIVVLLCKDTDDIEAFTNIVFDGKKENATKMLSKHSEFFADRLRRFKIKSDMIHNVDIYATVSYLEAQVDALTRIVLSLAPEGDLKKILEWADAYSVLDLKQTDKIIGELRTDKANIRGLQRRYYDAKR